MVWVVNEITFDFVSWRSWFSRVDQHRVIDAQLRIGGEITDEEIAPGKGGIQMGVSFLLIFRTMLKKHAEIAGPKISGEPAADVFLEHVRARFAHLAQICIAGKNHALILWQCLVQGRA